MDFTIHRTTQLFDRLKSEADARGVTVEVIATELLEATGGRRRHLSFAASGSSTTGRGATDAEALLTDSAG